MRERQTAFNAGYSYIIDGDNGFNTPDLWESSSYYNDYLSGAERALSGNPCYGVINIRPIEEKGPDSIYPKIKRKVKI